MFHWTAEGAKLKNGFNVYLPGDPSSIGFKLKIGNWAGMVRYSKNLKRMVFSSVQVDPKKLPDWTRV